MSAHGPHDALDGYFEEFGERFRDATAGARTPVRRARPRRGVALLASAAVTLAVAVVLLVALLPGSVGDRRVNVVDEAGAALGAPGTIIRMVVTSSVTDGPGTGTAMQTVEQFSAVAPTRWRLVQDINPTSGSVRDGTGQVIRGREEFAYADGELRRFLAERNVLEITRATSAEGPGVFGLPNRGDPAAELRAAAANGTVTDQGELTRDGRRVRRLVGVQGTGREARRFVYDVDPDTFAPISGTLRTARAPGVVARFRVERYERLPLTQDSAGLLRITTNSATTVRDRR